MDGVFQRPTSQEEKYTTGRRGEDVLSLGLASIQHLGKQEVAICSFSLLLSCHRCFPNAQKSKVLFPQCVNSDALKMEPPPSNHNGPECLWTRGSCTRGQEAERGGSEKSNRNRKLLFNSLSAQPRERLAEVLLKFKSSQVQALVSPYSLLTVEQCPVHLTEHHGRTHPK